MKIQIPKYSLPRIANLVRAASGHAIYSKVDLKAGFHNLRLTGDCSP